jgi:hypothetical protein
MFRHKALKFKRWETPVSDAKSLAMVSLLDNGELSITVQNARDPERRRFRFTFKNYPAYRNILEEYRTGRSEEFIDTSGKIGWTRIILESPWLASFKKSEPLLEELNPGLVHYEICTEDDVVEVLANEPPEVAEIEPAAEGEKPPGKSTVYYDPDDRDKIDVLINQIKSPSIDDV